MNPISFSDAGMTLTVDPVTGTARATAGDADIWTGSVVPALIVSGPDGRETRYPAISGTSGARDSVALVMDYGTGVSGRCELVHDDHGLLLRDLTLEFSATYSLCEVLFGVSPLTDEERRAVSDRSVPQWPDWSALAVCVPGLDPARSSSIARRWDLGQADVALGSFGPASGTPYGAAFPRPVLASAFGDDRGWVMIGAARIPTAQVSLMARATSFAMRWQFADDLWGHRSVVTIGDALRIGLAANPAEAWLWYSRSLPVSPRSRPRSATMTSFNTWGDFRHQSFDIDAQVRSALEVDAEVLVLDDGWETEESSGLPDSERIGDLDELVERIHAEGLEVGFWQSVGWVANPDLFGLTPDDLLCDSEGDPVKTNWALNPRDHAKFMVDPSTAGGQRFLRERTRRLAETYRPALFKLDFAYAFPSVTHAVPRDPEWRGEQLAYRVSEFIIGVAKQAHPEVAMLGYGAHPQFADLFDVISLDDMGDGGFENEAISHRHWSVWAAALGGWGIPVNGSGGYNSDQDGEVILNTAVLGSPGVIFATQDLREPAGVRKAARRRAIARWHRRTATWNPVWLDSDLGSPERQPRVRSWARSEPGGVSSLALRPSANGGRSTTFEGLSATGPVAVIAQGDSGLDQAAGTVAIIPCGAATITVPCRGTAVVTAFRERTAEPTTVTATDGAIVLTATDGDLDSGFEGWTVHRDDL